ncbi:Utp21 specific WD40 associated putative domain-containing protein [Pisolithus croceorrhizus]|nr:Utp21 specific WD40 associated putative domain-containing protein [Pisolithus croceorrhizus]
MAAPTEPDILDDNRPRKKTRTSSKRKSIKSTQRAAEPRLFAPFRALGLITNEIPFYVQTRSHKGATDGPRVHILTCLGKSWALWEGGKMTLLFVGPEVEDPISCVAMDGDAVWCASGLHAIKYHRGKEVLRVTNPLGSALSSLILFGSHLLVLTKDGTRMLIWDVSGPSPSLFATIDFDIGFTAVRMLHPATYLNKVLVASREGQMQLWNIRTQTCIHTISTSKLLTVSSSSPLSSPIVALAQSPAIDVVGVGFMSGEISVYDIRADERLMRMYVEGGGIRALSFRSDGNPVLASVSSLGHLALWDLNAGGRLLHLVRGAHDGGITSAEWVQDNSVKPAPRLLKARAGHQAPPHLISLRYTSVVRDSRSFELSQGSLSRKAITLSKSLSSLKFPPVTSISFSTTRSKDWDDVLTAHVDEPLVRSWSVLNKRLGEHTWNYHESSKRNARFRHCEVRLRYGMLATLALHGSSTGEIHMWNMQSGIKRKAFKLGPCPPELPGTKVETKKGDRAITGLATDALNRVVIASTQDGTINFFDFHTAKLQHTLTLCAPISSINLHRSSGLLAAICDDMTVRVIDIETRRVVRELAFSPDSRWIVTTSLDSTIRTFDIPTSRLIDAFRVPSMATSIAFSPTGDFLATAHVDSVGVFLWANRAQFAEVGFRSTEVSMPLMQGEVEDENLEALTALTMEDKPVDVFSTPPQLDGDLVTLTLLPRSRWQALLNLEVIEQRNRPKEPPKKPEQAPFFLPTLPGVEHRFAIDQKQSDTSGKKTRFDKAMAKSKSIFQEKLAELDNKGQQNDLFDYIKSLSPAAIDVELRSLVTLDHHRQFLRALKQRLLSHRDFEGIQTLQNVFLRLHGDVLVENVELQLELKELLELQKKESARILELLSSSLGTLAFVRETM